MSITSGVYRAFAPVMLCLVSFAGAAVAQTNLPNGANEVGFIPNHSQTESWTFSANQGDSNALGVRTGVNTSFWPPIKLLGPNGVAYGQNWGDLFAQVHTNAALTGTYTAVVSRFDSDTNGDSYSIALAKSPGTWIHTTIPLTGTYTVIVSRFDQA